MTVTWRASGGGVRPGQWVTLDVGWEGGDGKIINLLVIDGVPKHPLPRGRIISDGAKGVNPDSVNREGIRIEFNEFVQEGKADIAFEDGTLMNWTAEWEDASVLIVVGNGIRLINEAAYIITVETRNLAGNRINIKIRFVTG